MKPSIILTSGLTPKPVVKQLRQYGIPTARLDFSSIARIGESVGRLTELLDIPEGDAAIVQSWKTHFSGGEKPQLSGRPPGVVVLFGTSGLFCAGSGTFVEDLVEFHGGRNLPSTLDSSNWPEVAEETLLGWKPDIIIVHFDEDISAETGLTRFMSRWGSRPLWPEIPALRHGRVHVITDSRLSVPGPRILSVSDEFQRWIGEAQIPEEKSR
jgi:iron complex transport system substrate-binding protein